MRKFECTFIKNEKIATLGKGPMYLIRQDIITDKDGVNVKTPTGYTLFQIVEFLEPEYQKKNEKPSD
jgi:hypothetical protein